MTGNATHEDSPLLQQPSELNVYDRFTRREKYLIVAVVSWVGYLPLFISGSFMPSIPDIARDLKTTESVVGLAVSLSIIAASVGSLVSSRYSSYYGRRAIYLFGLPFVVAGSIGIAMAHSVPVMLVWRFVQAMGASPGFSVGGGVIGDIYPIERRGTAMGIYFAACLLGSALAPFVSGVISNYTSWRFVQVTLAGTGLLGFLLIALFYPETMHPGTRGIDRWRQKNGYGDEKFTFVWLNPLRVIALLKSLNLLSVSIAGFAILLSEYMLITPLATTLRDSYGIHDRAIVGLCYAPLGLGNIIGAPLAGRLSDHFVIKYRKSRNGVYYPEDRLRGTLVGAGILCPISVLGAGLLAQFAHTRAGLIAHLFCLFFAGIGVDTVLSPIAAYAVDIMQERSAESMAATNSSRALFLACAVSAIFPLLETIGQAYTHAIVAGMALLSSGLLYCCIRFGDRMRGLVSIE